MTAPSAPGDQWEVERRRLSRQVLTYARVVFVVIGLMPWWLPLLRAYLPMGPVGDVLDGCWLILCHRIPSRTLELAGVAMPVCSRCSGIFTGLALGALLMWPKLRLASARWLLAGALLLMLSDVLMQDFGIHGVWHSTRLISGALLGWVASAALMSAIAREGVRNRTPLQPKT